MVGPSPRLYVGLFTEVFHPIVNGVVASIDSLVAGLRRANCEVTTFAPHLTNDCASDDVIRFPSLPLPTSTGYRLCLPFLRRSDRERAGRCDVIHAHSPFVTGVYAARLARRSSVPLIYTYHTQLDAYAHYAPFARAQTRAALIELTRRFANHADVVIAPTEAMRERLHAFGVRTRIDVVPSAIDGERFRAGRRSRSVRSMLGARADEQRIVLSVARLGREKNIACAIEALRLLDERVVLAIVGAGPQRHELEQHVARAGLRARVRFCGAIDPARMPDVFASADVFVFTSITDTQGLVLSEARAAGLPIVAVESPVARAGAGADARFAGSNAAGLARTLAQSLDLVRSERQRERVATPADFAAGVQAIYRSVLRKRCRVPYVWHSLGEE